MTEDFLDFELGEYHYVYFLYFILFMGASFIKLIHHYQNSSGIQKNQIKYIFLGFSLTSLTGIITDIYLPSIGISNFYYLGPASTLFIIIFTTYAITKVNLMNIKFIISRGMSFLLSSLIYAFFSIPLIYLFSQVFEFGINYATFSFIVFLLLLTGLSFHPLRLLIQTTPDKYLFKKKYIYDQAISELSQKFTETTSLNEAVNVFKSIAKKAVKTKNLNIWITDWSGEFNLK